MDPILFWNEVALEANRVSHTNGAGEATGPTLSSRALAIVHLAMYDAYAGVDTAAALPHYITPASPAPAGASVSAAVAAAAHSTLSSLFPSQQSFFDLILAGAGDIANPGHAFGISVAQGILADRQMDPDSSAGAYTTSNARGRHRLDPENPGQSYHGPQYGAGSKGFAINERWELLAPSLDDSDYRKALKQVRRRGIAPELMGTLPTDSQRRSVDETVIGIYWGYDGSCGIGTPPRLYNQIVRKVALNKPNPDTGAINNPAQNARLFALANCAMADAGILAWDQKYLHDFWRPVVGIREHDMSMGPGAAVGDDNINNESQTDWLPLGAPNSNKIGKNFTPPFPAYPSGYATFGAAAFHVTRRFYGVTGYGNDNLFSGLDFVSDEFNGINKDNKGVTRPRHVRNFPGGLWQMIEENARSRVYMGVHWLFDGFAIQGENTPDLTQGASGIIAGIGGVPLGLKIADDIYDSGMTKSAVGPRS